MYSQLRRSREGALKSPFEGGYRGMSGRPECPGSRVRSPYLLARPGRGFPGGERPREQRPTRMLPLTPALSQGERV